MLVGSLPCAEAPAETAERVKDSLEARKPAIWQPEHFEQGVGARHLLFRRVMAAAAMIGLVAILAGVVYTIVRPASVADKTIVVSDWRPTRKVAVEKPATSVVATVEKPVAEIRMAAKGFNGRLELKTSALMAVDAFVSKAIENNGLLSVAGPRSREARGVYAISCSREALNLLLADLENVWDKFDSATLFVDTDRAGGEVVVEIVTAGQIAEIANQDGLESRIEVAKDFAALNNMAEHLPGKEVFAAISGRGADLMTIPKPVLTSDSEKIERPASRAKGEVQVYLIIVVAGSE